MRVVIFFLLSFSLIQSSFAQHPSKAQMQSQMNQFSSSLNKQIADLEKQIADKKKNKEDPATIKALEDQVKMLKQQAATMSGLNQNVSSMSGNSFNAINESPTLVPKKDLSRINMIPKKLMNRGELLIYIKNINAAVEKIIPPEEKQLALQEYEEVKKQYKSIAITANAANGFWMLGHWEKALIIMGKVCIDDMNDADNLNNYAAFLVMTGGEQAAIPILDYLNAEYPANSTIENNLGQAWFGLGDVANAKKFLNSATQSYANHSMANTTLAQIAQSEGDNAKAISFLKASIKENYDAEKEGQLEKLGYQLKFNDLPSLDYPMKHDPFGLIPLLNSWPENIQSSIDDDAPADAVKKYLKGIENFQKSLAEDGAKLKKPTVERTSKMQTDEDYRRNFTEAHRSPAYILAERMNLLYCYEKGGFCFRPFSNSFSLSTSLWIHAPTPTENMDKIMSLQEILEECKKIWTDSVLEPIKKLFVSFNSLVSPNFNYDCHEADQKLNAFLAKRKEIYLNGIRLIREYYVERSYKLDAWIKMNLYSLMDDPPVNTEGETFLFVSKLGRVTIEREKYKNSVYSSLVSIYNYAQRFSDKYRSYCEANPPHDPDPGADDLEHFKVKWVDCEFEKKFITPIRYEFLLVCNVIKEKIDPNLKKRQPDIQKGSVQNSSRDEELIGPLEIQQGPHRIFSQQENQDLWEYAPLTPEKKVSSQCSLEYDKWGNLIGFKSQFTQDDTALKDQNSNESGVNSRWSWNAIASPKKGYLNKLIIK